MPITENDLSEVYNGDVLSASGEKIGSVGQVYLDDQTGEPTFVTANTGLFGLSQSFVPLRGARVENGNVVVDFDRTTVKDAPRIDDDGSLSPAEEDQLYAYYGMGPTSADTADYGTADQPEPGSARADRNDAKSGDARLGDRTEDLGADASPGGRDLRPDGRGNRPAGANERVAAAGPGFGDEGIAREGSGGFGAMEGARHYDDDQTTPDAPPIGSDEGRFDQDRDSVGATAPTDEAATPGSSGRLRKWVRTEHEPVEREDVYVEGSGQPGERSTR